MVRKRRSKAMRDFNKISNALMNTTLNMTEKTAKWLITDHARTVEFSETLNILTRSRQRRNYQQAQDDFKERRFQRLIDSRERLFSTGKVDSDYERISAELVDYARYFWDLFWGYMKPVLIAIGWHLSRILMIWLYNFIFSMGCFTCYFPKHSNLALYGAYLKSKSFCGFLSILYEVPIQI